MRRINIDQFMTPYNDLSEGYAAKMRAQEGMTAAMANIGATLAQRKAQERSLLAQREEGALDRASREGIEQRRLADAVAERGATDQKAQQAAERERSVRVGRIIAAHQDEADPAKRAAMESQLASDGVTIGAEKTGSYIGEMEQGPTNEIDSVPDVKMDLSLQTPKSPLGFGDELGFGGPRPNVKALSPGGSGEAVGADPSLISPFGLGTPNRLSLKTMDTAPPSQGMFYMFKGQPIAPINVTLGDAQETRAAQAGRQIAPFAQGGTEDQNATFGKALTGATDSAALGVPVKDAVDTALKSTGQLFQNESSKRHTPGGGGGKGGAPEGPSTAETRLNYDGYKMVLQTSQANEKAEKYRSSLEMKHMIENERGLTDQGIKVQLATSMQSGVLSDKDFVRGVGGETWAQQLVQWFNQGMKGEMSDDLRERFKRGINAYHESSKRELKVAARTTRAFAYHPAVTDPRLQAVWESSFGQYAAELEEGGPSGGSLAGPAGAAPVAPSAPTPGTTGNKEATVIDDDTARELEEINKALGLQ